jgi:hypothetical protein
MTISKSKRPRHPTQLAKQIFDIARWCLNLNPGSYSEQRSAGCSWNQEAPPNGLWLAKSGMGGK